MAIVVVAAFAVIARPSGRSRFGGLPREGVVAWLEAAGIAEGPLSRPIAKAACPLHPAEPQSRRQRRESLPAPGARRADFSGHSLRSGFLTSAARRGASVFSTRRVPAQCREAVSYGDEPRGITARPRQAVDEAGADWIGDLDEPSARHASPVEHTTRGDQGQDDVRSSATSSAPYPP